MREYEDVTISLARMLFDCYQAQFFEEAKMAGGIANVFKKMLEKVEYVLFFARYDCAH